MAREFSVIVERDSEGHFVAESCHNIPKSWVYPLDALRVSFHRR